MNRTVLLVVPALALASYAGYAAASTSAPSVAHAATSSDQETGVDLVGTGKVSGAPDVLRVGFGVSSTADDVSAALAAANAAQSRVVGALHKAGVADKDLQTTGLSIGQRYDNKGRPTGYAVSEQVTAKLRDLPHAGAAITSAVGAGGNAVRLGGVSFNLEDDKALLQEARDQAFDDAKAKAERYAERAGRSLGDVQLVTEETGDAQQASFAKTLDLAARDVAAVPLQAGQQQVSVVVHVRWSLK